MHSACLEHNLCVQHIACLSKTSGLHQCRCVWNHEYGVEALICLDYLVTYGERHAEAQMMLRSLSQRVLSAPSGP